MAWRIVILLLGVFAEGWNIKNMLQSGEPPTEHFAYFTVQANIAVIVLMVWMLLVRQEHRPRWFDHVRGAITAYIVLAGIVYAVLLAEPDEVWAWSVEFTNAAQHRFIPWLVGLDWLLVATARPIRVSRAAWWMAYPVAFLVFAWLRGGLLDDWFPYPFLDPAEHGGWGGLVWPTGQVLFAFVLGILLVAVVGRLRWRPERGGRADAVTDRRGPDAAALRGAESRAAQSPSGSHSASFVSSPSSTSSSP